MKAQKIVSVLLSLIIPSLLYTYYYPWVYNKVNNYTKRGENLDDKVDFLNVFLVFIITWVFIAVFTMSIIAPIILKKKKK
tara:strand:+ start:387 stop:626 length:240 start_codon:yes stop_codon:yes gene_type:complete